ncbi:dihydrouridine synthase, partial [Toxoplasma gondii p89]
LLFLELFAFSESLQSSRSLEHLVSPFSVAALPRSEAALVLDEERRLQDTLRLCDAFEAAGCACLCIHGRTKEEKAAFVGPCDWLAIRHVKQRLSIPVIANGAVETYEDALRCLEFTGADAVMSAEGLLDNPMLFAPSRFAPSSFCALSFPSFLPFSPFLSFSPLRDSLRGRLSASSRLHAVPRASCEFLGLSPGLLQRCLVMQEYLDLCMRFPPPHPSFVKSHLFRCLHPVLAEHEELRNSLGKVRRDAEKKEKCLAKNNEPPNRKRFRIFSDKCRTLT